MRRSRRVKDKDNDESPRGGRSDARIGETEPLRSNVAIGAATWRQWPLWVKFALLLGLTLRVIFLEWKSPHFDEAINGHFVNRIWTEGSYPYDPKNFHGPMYFYVLHLGEILFGRGIFAFRFVTALLSAGLVFVVAAHARFLGRAAYWAAVVVALSPAMVFYGRYAIHETLFVLCQVIFSYGFLKWRFEGGRDSVAMMLGGTAAAFANKETFFIFTGTWLIAWGMVVLAEKFLPAKSDQADRERVRRPRDSGGSEEWIWIGTVCVFVVCALFTGFFTRPQGFRHMVEAYDFWTKTGTTNSGQEKPFPYWLECLRHYEWPALVALTVAPIACLFGSVWMRLFTLVGFGSWLAYSIIPYKTPWCILSMIWPLAFAFGFLMSEWSSRLPLRGLTATALLSTVFVSGATTLRLNFRDFEAKGEPYVYVQSTQDVNRMTRLLKGRLALHPEDRNMPIQVFVKEPWPLPWLLSLYTRVDYTPYSDTVPVAGDVIFADSDTAVALERRLTKDYWRRPFHMRDSYQSGYVYYDLDKFRGLIPSTSERVGPASKPVPSETPVPAKSEPSGEVK